jgi:imidazolonepropionase
MVERTIWYDATLVTLRAENDFDIIKNGAMIIEDDHIVWVGEVSALNKEQEKQAHWISAKGGLITPGLIDCHTHLVYAGNRENEWSRRLKGECYEALTSEGQGIYATVTATRAANEADLLIASLARAQNMLRGGVTTIEIKSGYGLDRETEIKILKVARDIQRILPIDVQTTCLGAHVLPKEFASKPDYIEYLIEVVLPDLIKEGLVDAVDGFCDSIAFSVDELEPLFQFAKDNHLFIKIHCDQLSPGQGAKLISRYQGLSADHLEYIDERGVQALSQSQTVAVLLPGAHYFLNQTKIPPISLFRKYHVPMSIATDCNPGTSPTTSLLLMMNMACVQYGLTPLEALQAVTIHAAKALGMQKNKGKLEPGMIADCVLWEYDDPIELSYHFGVDPCLAVIKRGKIVYEKYSRDKGAFTSGEVLAD